MTIDRLTLNDPEARSADPVAENVAALKALFPAAVADGRIDFDTLRQLLGDEVDDGDERYGLNWPGKRRARRLALTPSTGTLRPAREDSVEWDSTRNLMIEGDNLEVLKLLQKSFAGKVNCIYIDPPYNTGNDFVYPDDYVDNIRNYLARSGQLDNEGQANTSNTESGGRFHTNWLNLMYPRLMAARALLHDNGYIFVSIDYREFSNVKSALDSIMGEENLVNIFSWVRTRTPAALSQKTKNVAEYILCYEKTNVNQALLGLAKPTQSANTLLNMPNRVSELTFPPTIDVGLADGIYEAGLYGSETYPVQLLKTVEVKDGKLTSPITLLARFRWSQTYLMSQLENGVTVRIATSRFLPSYEKAEYGREAMPNLIDSGVGVGTNENATAELTDLMGSKVFSYPKPVSLLRYLVNSSAQNDIVMDFFAGSGSTGHAVMAQNAEDKGNRRYILVQLPEHLDPTEKEQEASAVFCDQIGKDRNIAELTKERLRRAAAKIKADYPHTQADLGFRVYKLATSNLRAWEPGKDLAADLLAAADNIMQGRTEDDLLTELLLKQGIDLTEPMLTETIAGAPVHAMGGGVLVVCLAPVAAANAEALADGIADWILRLNPVAATTVFFKDTGFENDVAKANVAAILEQRLEEQLLKVRNL